MQRRASWASALAATAPRLPCTNTRVRSWTPTAKSRYELPGHPRRRIDLDCGLLHAARRPQDRLPADLPLCLSPVQRRGAVAARDVRRQAGERQPERFHILDENEIIDGIDDSACVYGHERNAYWYGSQLSIDETPQLAPYQNATGLQVTSAVLAGMVWALENP